MSPIDEQLEQEICVFISNKLGIKLKDISADKSLNFDLGVDGDDAVELFLANSEGFQVDLTPLGPEWDRYFGPEGLNPLWLLSFLSWPFNKKQRRPMLPLPVSRLIASARDGKWMPLE